jgi:hypothetical protein
VQPDDEMITECANLRLQCQQVGHALGDKLHDGDRWIASTALRLGLPLVSHDGLFDGAPALELVTVLGDQERRHADAHSVARERTPYPSFFADGSDRHA